MLSVKYKVQVPGRLFNHQLTSQSVTRELLAYLRTLTYMSIRDRIRALDGKELFCLAPLAGGSLVRTMFVSREVLDAVTPPFPPHWDGQRLGQFRGTLDAFAENQWISIASDPYNKSAQTYLAPVDPVALDIWDIRSIAPLPQIRCFGAWSEQDTFVALTWEYRDGIDFDAEAKRCRAVWDKFLSPCKPFHGRNPDDYLSDRFYAV
jgi:hypothetical protein